MEFRFPGWLQTAIFAASFVVILVVLNFVQGRPTSWEDIPLIVVGLLVLYILTHLRWRGGSGR